MTSAFVVFIVSTAIFTPAIVNAGGRLNDMALAAPQEHLPVVLSGLSPASPVLWRGRTATVYHHRT